MSGIVDVSIELVASQEAKCSEVEILLREDREALTCLSVEECIQVVLGLLQEGAGLDEALRKKACSDPTWWCEDLYGKLNTHLLRVENLATGALNLGRHFVENGYEVKCLETLESGLSELRWMIRPESFDWGFLEEPLLQAINEDQRGKTESLLPLPE